MPSYVVAIPDEELAEQVALALRQGGGCVSLACDGDEALFFVERDHPELVILDLDLPVISGMSVLYLLRSEAATRRLPVIALSRRSYDDEREARTLGVSAFLTKPAASDQLAAFAARIVRQPTSPVPVAA